MLRKYWKDQKYTDKYLLTTFKKRDREKMKTRKNKNHQEDCLKKLYEIKSGNKNLVKLLNSVLLREKCKKVRLQLEHLEFEIKIVNTKTEKNKLEQKVKEILRSYEKPKDLDLPEPPVPKQIINLIHSNHHGNHKIKHSINNQYKVENKKVEKDVSFLDASFTDKQDKKDKSGLINKKQATQKVYNQNVSGYKLFNNH